MSYFLSEDQLAIRDAVEKLCANFDAEYWLERDTDGSFPTEFVDAIAAGGWLGLAMPEEYGGSGLGITEASLMMQAVAQSGAGFTGASAIHLNVFGLYRVVVFGTDEQKQRMLPDTYPGREKGLFRGDRTERGSRHPESRRARGTYRRRLPHQRAETLDVDGAARRKSVVARAHYAEGRSKKENRGIESVLYRSEP